MWTNRAVPRQMGDGRIRVLFVIGSLDIGGAEKQLVEIALGLDRTRFTPAVCCLVGGGPLGAVLQQGGVPVIDLGLRGVREVGWLRATVGTPRAVWRFADALRRSRPDVVHGMLFHAYVLSAAVGALARVPVIVASRRSLSHFKRGRLHFMLAERIANAFTDCIVANSEAVRRDTVESERLSDEAVLVIHNGIDAGRYVQPHDPKFRREVGAGGGPVAVVLANFIHYKGHQYFLDAWAEVCRMYPDATALLVGDGPLRAQYEEEVRTRGLGERVRFLGTRKDVPQVLRAGDLLVHPSLEEGFSNALLEAMAAGLPVVATAVGGNPEAVRDGHTGYLVPARDSGALAAAILRVLGQPDRGRALGEAGRQRVLDEFQLGTMVRKYEDLYTALLTKHESGQRDVRYSGAV